MPMTSRGQKWTEIHECAFITTFLPSFLRTYEPHKFTYRIYVGIDDCDAYFQKHREALKSRLGPEDKIFSYPDSYKGNPCGIWTQLMKEAHKDGADYFQQYGDDIRIESRLWTSYFVAILKKSNGVGAVGGCDEKFWISRLSHRQIGILENAMVTRHHWDTFGFFFPPELKSWWSDDWISRVYGSRCFTAPAIHFSNTNRVGDHNELSRYQPDKSDADKWMSYATRDAAKLEKALQENN